MQDGALMTKASIFNVQGAKYHSSSIANCTQSIGQAVPLDGHVVSALELASTIKQLRP